YLKTTVVCSTVWFLMGYAAGYRNLSLCNPDSFNAPLSSIDAVYFALTTLATVGYGDIVARTQFGRALVVTQLLGTVTFAVLFAGVLVNVVARKPEGGDRSPRTPDASQSASIGTGPRAPGSEDAAD